MSEGDDSLARDLTTAFDHLVDDVEACARTPGAHQAIRSAGRRRLAAAGGAVTVIAVAVVILVGTLGLSGRQAHPPVAVPISTDPRPSPVRIDASIINAATQGWTDGWTSGPPALSARFPCDAGSFVLPGPVDSSTRQFRIGQQIGAVLTVKRFDTPEGAGDSTSWLVDPSCRGELRSLPDEIWTGADSIGSVVYNGRQRFHQIVAVRDNEVAVLEVVGAGRLPDEVRERLVRVMLADLMT